jgi:hypothetical protein
MQPDSWRCLVSERAARLILRALAMYPHRDDHEDVCEILRIIRVQYPALQNDFPDLPWPGKSG